MSIITPILQLIGSLGFLLYGMKLMSDGVQKSAGEKLQRALSVVTGNRYIGILTGLIITMVIQSSGATTAMVVTFVNAGLLTLTQSVGVIFGANIGTTITGQLVSFNLSKYAPLFLFIGVIMTMFIKKPTAQKIGQVVLGFGVLFMGIKTMSGSMEALNESGQISNILLGLSNPFAFYVAALCFI